MTSDASRFVRHADELQKLTSANTTLKEECERLRRSVVGYQRSNCQMRLELDALRRVARAKRATRRRGKPTPLEELFGIRILNILENANVASLDDLFAVGYWAIRGWPWVGRATLKEMELCLEQHGFSVYEWRRNPQNAPTAKGGHES